MNSPTIAIIGAGRMGAALAYQFGVSGLSVRVADPSSEAREHAPTELRRIAALCGTDTPEIELFDDSAAAARGSDIVIEAATENVKLKRSIFEQISRAAPDAILTTNTSSIPLRELVPVIVGPERFLGTHFWNPPYAVKLVEVVGHDTTSASARDTVFDAARAGGFVPVEVRVDIPGLIGNRLQHALKREAIALVAAGVCDAETVDTVAKLTIGRRLEVLGPLEQSDLVGLDLTLAIHRTLLPELDRTDHAQPYLEELVSDGNLGMKTGKGFRSWTPEQAATVRDRLDQHLMAGLHGQADELDSEGSAP